MDRARDGFLGKIGLGKKSELDTVFRVCAKTLAAFIKAQYVDVDTKKKIGTLRIVEKDPFSLKENLALYKDVSFKKYIKKLGDSYIARVSEYFYDIMSSPEFTIFSYSRLLASIAECVYQGKALELSCFRDDIEVELDVKSAVASIIEEMRNSGSLDSGMVLRNGSAHLGSLGSVGFSQRTVFELGGTDLVISLIRDPEFQKGKEDITGGPHRAVGARPRGPRHPGIRHLQGRDPRHPCNRQVHVLRRGGCVPPALRPPRGRRDLQGDHF